MVLTVRLGWVLPLGVGAQGLGLVGLGLAGGVIRKKRIFAANERK
jgi:hypothetical protein